MHPGTDHIRWGTGALLLGGSTGGLAAWLQASTPGFAGAGGMAIWLFLAAGAVLGLTGAFLLLIGLRERDQYRRARASIPAAPDHCPASLDELALRVMVSLAASDGDLSEDEIAVLRQVLPDERVGSTERDSLAHAVSSDPAAEVLAAEDSLDAPARDFILSCCFRMIDAMDDPGPVQEALILRIAAAMGLSEQGLIDSQQRYEEIAPDIPRRH